jgi:mannose-1-phosphate guanylyltransferase
MLNRRGISKMLFLPSYKSEVIVDFLKMENDRTGLSANWSVEPSPLGTGGALKHADTLREDSFFVSNGDSYLEMDYAGLAGKFKESGADAMMTIYDNSAHTNVPNNVAVAADGAVVRYSKEKTGKDLNFVDAGVLAMRRRVADLIPAGEICSLENEIYPKLIEGKRFRTFLTRERFYDIGTPERLKEFERMITR